MTQNSLGFAILAAGKGTRLKLREAKVLAPVLGKCLIDFPIMAIKNFAKTYPACQVEMTAVVGHQREQVTGYLKSGHEGLKFAIQEQQNGTADAVRSYFGDNPEARNLDYTVIMCGDTPLITENELSQMWSIIVEKPGIKAVAATFKVSDPTGYGRIQRAEQGFTIVEHKDASPAQREIKEVNSGLYIIKTDYLISQLEGIDSNNASGEFYLTDVFKAGEAVQALCFEDPTAFLGVNNQIQLEESAHHLKMRKIESLRDKGVLVIDSTSVHFDWDVEIGENSRIYPNNYFYGKTQLGSDVTVAPGCILTDSVVENGVQLKPYCVFEEAIVRNEATIGPFTRLRPAADVGEKSKIGNFVEIKKSKLDREVKVSHLSYVGDAKVGENSNIGCGFITCNYDGINKHVTDIGKNVFIGSDCQAVAPLKIGDNCFVAAGSTVTSDMEEYDFAIARSRQATKKGLAKKYIKPN